MKGYFEKKCLVSRREYPEPKIIKMRMVIIFQSEQIKHLDNVFDLYSKEKVNDHNNMGDTTKMVGSKNKSWQNLLFRKKKNYQMAVSMKKIDQRLSFLPLFHLPCVSNI